MRSRLCDHSDAHVALIWKTRKKTGKYKWNPRYPWFYNDQLSPKFYDVTYHFFNDHYQRYYIEAIIVSFCSCHLLCKQQWAGIRFSKSRTHRNVHTNNNNFITKNDNKWSIVGSYRHFDAHFNVGDFLSQAFGNRGYCIFTSWIHAIDWLGARHTCIHLMAKNTVDSMDINGKKINDGNFFLRNKLGRCDLLHHRLYLFILTIWPSKPCSFIIFMVSRVHISMPIKLFSNMYRSSRVLFSSSSMHLL